MSSSKSSVTVSISRGQGELEIIDGGFHVVERGSGMLTMELAPGIYKARARVGAAYQDTLFVVEPDSVKTQVDVKPVPFASALPLHFTTTSHEYHQAAIEKATKEPPANLGLGSGAKILVVIRDPSDANQRWTKTESMRANYERTFQGFRLRNTTGKLLVDLDTQAQTKLDDGCVILSVHAEAAPVVLTLERTGADSIAMPIPLRQGWQSQLFINVDVPEAIEASGTPLLADRSVMMAPMGYSFYAGDEYLRLTEVARAALQDGRTAISEEQLRKLLQEKFSNPILGLLGAHLLLMESTPNLELLGIVTQNVAYLLGEDFPDVIALRAGVTRATGKPYQLSKPVSLPPLLRRSWDILAEFPSFMPGGSLNRSVATNIVDAGVWLTWVPEWPGDRSAWMKDLQLDVGKGVARSIKRMDLGVNVLEPAGTHPGTRKAAAPAKSDPYASLATAITTLATSVEWMHLLTKGNAQLQGDFLRSLNGLQRSLVQTVRLVGSQVLEGDEFTSAEAAQLCARLSLPVSIVQENLNELAQIARAFMPMRSAKPPITDIRIQEP